MDSNTLGRVGMILIAIGLALASIINIMQNEEIEKLTLRVAAIEAQHEVVEPDTKRGK